MKQKFTYKTIIQENKDVTRYKCWKEEFKDEDSGNSVWIDRMELIKVNGVVVRFYANSEIKRMSAHQKRLIFAKIPRREK